MGEKAARNLAAENMTLTDDVASLQKKVAELEVTQESMKAVSVAGPTHIYGNIS